MPFVQGKCESCGGILTVDPSLKSANCPFCGAAYIVQDSISYYKTTINVDTIHANVVNVSDESSSEGRLKAAEAYMKMGKYDKAENEYKYVTEIAPQNYRGWLGLIEIYTNIYTKRIKSATKIRSLEDTANTIKAITSKEETLQALEKYNIYINSEIEKNNNELMTLNNTLEEHVNKVGYLQSQKRSLEDSLCDLKQKSNSLNNTYDSAGTLIGIGLVAFFAGSFVIIVIPGLGIVVNAIFVIILLSGLVMTINGLKQMISNKSNRAEIKNLLPRINEYSIQITELEQQIASTQDVIEEYKSKINEYI
ncbi:MAG: hypothetical protein K5874_02595 [Bacteroidaceae bacterium]|nr:hypothetical protein [Bacteroidaceae bacterium]